jgi:excisionase family DNA binding protein
MQGTETGSIQTGGAPASAPLSKLLFSKAEAAGLLSISVRALDYQIALGELDVFKIGARVLISRTALQQFARKDHPGRVQ